MPFVLGVVLGLPLFFVSICIGIQHLRFHHAENRSAAQLRRLTDLTHLLHLMAYRADLGLEPCPTPLREQALVLPQLDSQINQCLIALANHPSPPVPPHLAMSPAAKPIVESLRTLPSRLSDVGPSAWREQHEQALRDLIGQIDPLPSDHHHHFHPLPHSMAAIPLTNALVDPLPQAVLELNAALQAGSRIMDSDAGDPSRVEFLTRTERACQSLRNAMRDWQQLEDTVTRLKLHNVSSERFEFDRVHAHLDQLHALAKTLQSSGHTDLDSIWLEVTQVRRDTEQLVQEAAFYVEKIHEQDAGRNHRTGVLILLGTLVTAGFMAVGLIAWQRNVRQSIDALQELVKTSPAEPATITPTWMGLNSDIVPILRDRQRISTLLQTSNNRAQEAARRSVLADREAREYKEQLELLRAASQDSVWDWDIRTDYVDRCTQLWKCLGYRAENIPTSSFSALADRIHPDDRTAVTKALRNHLENRLPYACEYRLQTVTGEYRWFHDRGHAKWDDLGRPIRMVGTIRDVTERRRLEEEHRHYVADLQKSRDEISAQATRLQRQTEELESARNRAEVASRSKGEFLANMSHELRTPLTAMLGYADLLYDEGDVTKAPRSRLDMIESIRTNGQHLLQLIDDILDLAKIDAGKMSIEFVPCQPAPILQQVCRLLELRARSKGLEFVVRAVGALPTEFLSDPVRLRQILVNLLGNAIKFTSTGRITLEMSARREPSEMLVITVTDTGIGMNAEQIAKLFQPFDQADASTTRQFGGTGLGLSISQRLAHLLGGEISVNSELGRGSTFTVSLRIDVPRGTEWLEIEPVCVPAEPMEPMRTASMLENARILVVDDVECNRRLIGFVLNQSQATVVYAANGEEALRLLLSDEAPSEPFDIVLMDMQMPVLDGYEAVRRLRSQGYRGPIIAMTARAMAEDRQECLAAGCDDYLTKPIDRHHLLEVCTHFRFAVPTAAR